MARRKAPEKRSRAEDNQKEYPKQTDAGKEEGDSNPRFCEEGNKQGQEAEESPCLDTCDGGFGGPGLRNWMTEQIEENESGENESYAG